VVTEVWALRNQDHRRIQARCPTCPTLTVLAVRAILRFMEQKEEVRSIQLQELRGRVDKGFAQAERGEGADGETFMQALIDDLDRR
jgi:hypothetical protein